MLTLLVITSLRSIWVEFTLAPYIIRSIKLSGPPEQGSISTLSVELIKRCTQVQKYRTMSDIPVSRGFYLPFPLPSCMMKCNQKMIKYTRFELLKCITWSYILFSFFHHLTFHAIRFGFWFSAGWEAAVLGWITGYNTIGTVVCRNVFDLCFGSYISKGDRHHKCIAFYCGILLSIKLCRTGKIMSIFYQYHNST